MTDLYGLRSFKLKAFALPIQDEFPGLSGENFRYADGVIETGGLKGPVLEEVLAKQKQPPSKIIFVDDQREQIESIHRVCEKAGIPCVAFHFTVCLKGSPLDEEVADYQLRTLVKEHRWVSEEQARAVKDKRSPRR